MKRFNYTLGATLFWIVLSGCVQAQSTLEPAGPAAQTISDLSWFVYLLFTAVALVMWGLLWWVAVRRRGTFDEHEPVDVEGGRSWILIGGLGIPFVVLAVIFVMSQQVMMQSMPHGGEISAPEIRLVGHQWWWEVQYVGGTPDNHFATANEIHIPVGKTVQLELASNDVIHSFWVPNLSGKVDLIPGHTNRMQLRADKPGVYQGKCAEYCGTQHATMRIIVVAEPANEYETWRAQQLKPASTPGTPEEFRGQELFMSRACVLCHTVRGTLARGGVAPDLTHLASRRGLAANTLTNDKANLAAWAIHAQSLKPGAKMPNVVQFSGEELQYLVSYLAQLR
jgi:cytochrome c oxidase subunit II